MKKKLFTYTALAILSLACCPAFADCVCGTMGCEPCDNTEDYLEDVGKHIKKQSHRLNKQIKRQKKANQTNNSCAGTNPEFWSEEAVILNNNGNIILSYAEMVDDNNFTLTEAQRIQAKTDAKNLKEAGQKLKDKASVEKKKCTQTLAVMEEVEEIIPTSTKKSAMQPQMMWMDAIEEDGNMLIEVGEFIETNMAN